MRLFDKVKRKENQENKKIEKSPYDVKYSATNDGKLQVDFYENNADFKQFYDTTRLIINNQPVRVEGKDIYEALLSWYSLDDAIMIDKYGNDMGRREQYEKIQLGIDTNLLRADFNYCISVMKKLLNKKRVEEYLNRGLKEQPEIPCGNYVGEIVKTEQGYKKYFESRVGLAIHNSNEMIKRRERHKRILEESNKQRIDSKRKEIERLQSEIEDLSK